MLPKIFRLTTAEIRHVLQNGTKRANGPVKIQYLKAAGLHAKAAIIVPKSLDKRAVVRNRVKRVYRQALRHQLSALSSIHLVVTVYRGDMHITVSDADMLMGNFLKKL